MEQEGDHRAGSCPSGREIKSCPGPTFGEEKSHGRPALSRGSWSMHVLFRTAREPRTSARDCGSTRLISGPIACVDRDLCAARAAPEPSCRFPVSYWAPVIDTIRPPARREDDSGITFFLGFASPEQLDRERLKDDDARRLEYPDPRTRRGPQHLVTNVEVVTRRGCTAAGLRSSVVEGGWGRLRRGRGRRPRPRLFVYNDNESVRVRAILG